MAGEWGADRGDRSSDHHLWRRSVAADAPENDGERFLDLAALAEGRVDAEDGDRIAAWLDCDTALASDIATARALASAEHAAVPDAMIARACALVSEPASATADVDTPSSSQVIPFPSWRRAGPTLPAVAQWASLAAAVVVASWLGFAMGSDTSTTLGGTVQASDGVLTREFLDPSIGFMRDLTDGSRT